MYNVQPVTKYETSKKIYSHKQEVIKDPPPPPPKWNPDQTANTTKEQFTRSIQDIQDISAINCSGYI